MSNTVEEPRATPNQAANAMPLGAVLTAARERHRLSIEDVSGHLRLSPRQIMALESDNFAALPEAMITRGFIRNYARFLQIDPEPLLQAYRGYAPSAETYRISIDSANIPIENRYKRPWKLYFNASLVIAALVGLWVVYMDYMPKQPFSSLFGSSASESTPANLPATQIPMPVETGGGYVPPPEVELEMPLSQATPAAATQNTIPAEVSEPATSSAATIRLTFTGSSWVSVSDANSKILDITKPAGSAETVQGKPPFRIVIGNAAGSQLVYNGKTIDLAPHTKLNVARLTLE